MLPICPELAGYSMSRNRRIPASNRSNNINSCSFQFSMIRKYTEENHGGGDEENNHQPTVQVDHCTAADLGLTGEMARLSPRQSEMERDRQGGDREMSR